MLDMAPGDTVEMYRGEEDPEIGLVHGAKFLVEEVWFIQGPSVCIDCIPGFQAPAIHIAGFPRTITHPCGIVEAMCSCIFRPIRKPPPEAVTRKAGIKENA